MRLHFVFKHSCVVEFLSTVLTNSVLQKAHQLKDWLPLPRVHLFLALTINSCQRTASRQPSTCKQRCFSQYFLLAGSLAWSHWCFSHVWFVKSCRLLIMCNGVGLTMSCLLLTYRLCLVTVLRFTI